MRRVERGQQRVRSAARLGHVVLVGEARHGVVGLRLEAGARNPPFGGGREHRKPHAGEQIADERRQEHRLAGAGEAGHAEAQAAARKIVAERAGDERRLEREIGEKRQDAIRVSKCQPRLCRARAGGLDRGQSVSASELRGGQEPGEQSAPRIDVVPRGDVEIDHRDGAGRKFRTPGGATPDGRR